MPDQVITGASAVSSTEAAKPPATTIAPAPTAQTNQSNRIIVSDTFRRLRATEIVKVQKTSATGGQSTRVDTLVKTTGKYPTVVVRQNFSGDSPVAENLRQESAFVADHVLITPEADESSDAFQTRLNQFGYRILKTLPNSNIHLVSVGNGSIDAVDRATKLLARAEPDYLVFTQETLGSAKELIWVPEAQRFLDPETQNWWQDNDNGPSVPSALTSLIQADAATSTSSDGSRLLDFENRSGDYRPYAYRHGFKIARSTNESSVYIQNAYTSGYPENGGFYLRSLYGDLDTDFEHKDGLPFKAHSVDLAEYSTVFPTPKTVRVTGTKQDGTTVFTQFTTDGIIDGAGPQKDFQTFQFPASFDSLVKLRFSDQPFMLDNLLVTLNGQETPPPVPPTLPVIYDVNWDEAPHVIGQVSAVGGHHAPSSLNFGNPIVRETFGVLNNRPLELIDGGNSSNYSQPRFDLKLNAKTYRVEFDLTSLDNSDSTSVFFDGITNFVRFTFSPSSISMHGGSLVSIPFSASALNRVVIDVNLTTNTYTLQLNNQTPVTGSITSVLADVAAIRFSTSDGGTQGGSAIDNVRISAFQIGEQTTAPIATVFPSAGLTFPTVALGSSVTRLIEFRNAGLSPLTLQVLSISDPQFSLDAPLPAQLGAGQPFFLSTRFTPTTTGSPTAELRVATNDPNKPIVTIPLSGTVQTPPRISLEPAHLRVNMVADTKGTERFTIRNTGTSPLNWQIIRLQPTGGGTPAPRNTNDPQLPFLWGMLSSLQGGIDAQAAWNQNTGSANITVAVIDTGVSLSHPDLAANIKQNSAEIAGNQIDDDHNGFVDDVRGWNFYSDTSNADDVNGHGTHVSGTIAALGNNATGVVGVSWNSKVLPVQFLSAGGSGYTSDAIASVDYARQRGARLINASWGGGGFSSYLQQSIQNFCATNNGLFVAAAGNQGTNNDSAPHYPSNYTTAGIISVASTTKSSQLSSFSNYGKISVDLAAPGSDIISCLPGARYASYSGTSMAAPHVTGAAALLMSANPDYPNHQVKSYLMVSTDYPPALNQKVASDGRLNVYQSLRKMPETWINPLTTSGTVGPGLASSIDLEVNTFGLAPGTYNILLALATNDPDRLSLQLPVELKVVAPNALATWRNLNFAPNQLLHLESEETLWSDYADPDNDGISNLLEFALALAPRQSDSMSKAMSLNPPGESGAKLIVTTRTQLGPVSIVPEWSTNLHPDSWSSSGIIMDEVSADPIKGTTTWEITLDPSLGNPPSAFFRVRADSNGN
ncbi:S8 family serine peptidase [Phragmitibacter flavus]|uniref:S8 family serine peptidase n=1 Tax=Phragmitibacter flavus TaxID=2576071 RepID=UPI0014084D47|nr:S8 family serine peptidase [Phragmitibacter flavus]